MRRWWLPWYDGVDDYVEVDVNDWVGNFTIAILANATTLPDYASVLQFQTMLARTHVPTCYLQRRMETAQQPNTRLRGYRGTTMDASRHRV